MGMGEPMSNERHVFASISRLTDPDGMRLGARHITVSTVGVVPGIDRLATAHPQVGLAVSFHAADDALRDELVPANRLWPLRELEAADRPGGASAPAAGRRIEWAMIDGVNDSTAGRAPGADRPTPPRAREPDPAEPHARVAHRSRARSAGSRRSRGRLAHAGVNVTVRDTRGRSIDAACGQLRLEHDRRTASGTAPKNPVPSGLRARRRPSDNWHRRPRSRARRWRVAGWEPMAMTEEYPAYLDEMEVGDERSLRARIDALTAEIGALNRALDDARRGKRILLIEGEDLTNEVVRFLHEDLGLDVTRKARAADGEELWLPDAEGRPWASVQVISLGRRQRHQAGRRARDAASRAVGRTRSTPVLLVVNTFRTSQDLAERDARPGRRRPARGRGPRSWSFERWTWSAWASAPRTASRPPSSSATR